MTTSVENISFTNDISSAINAFLKESAYSNIAMLVDENTEIHCLPILDISPNIMIKIKAGEENKTLRTCEYIWKKLTEAHFDRNSVLINLGGGVIGDMGGFCAATYKRGIDFINIPTTLLAQVDASIGGKLGIDFGVFKNHIGVFKDPKVVFIDTQFLKTLPKRELRSGFAEVIKHHLIVDEKGWKNLQQIPWDDNEWSAIVQHSIQIKAEIVKSDPLESGRRKLLNFGHTVGHAIESYYLHTDNKLLHGEAIAIGMIAESYISTKNGKLREQSLKDIATFLKKVFRPTPVNNHEDIAGLALQDKKNKSGKILSVLLREIGDANWDQEITKEDVIQSLQFANQT